MPTLAERAAEIAKLDAARTQGEWSEDVCKGLWRDGHQIAIRDGKLPTREVIQSLHDGQIDADGAFIAAAPRMAQLISDQAAEIQRLEAAVKGAREAAIREAADICEQRACSVRGGSAETGARQCRADILSLLTTKPSEGGL